MNRYVGFFQSSNDGTGYAYFAEAENADQARENIFNHFAEQYGDDAGEVACYSPSELREMADRLERDDVLFDVPAKPRDERPAPMYWGRFNYAVSVSETVTKEAWIVGCIAIQPIESDALPFEVVVDAWSFTHTPTGRKMFQASGDLEKAEVVARQLASVTGVDTSVHEDAAEAYRDWCGPLVIGDKVSQLCRNAGLERLDPLLV